MESYLSELLPERFKDRHKLMLYSYDILVDILMKADKYGLSNLSFEFTNNLIDEISEDFNIFDELNCRKDVEISEKLLIPHIYFSLLRDLNYYLYESLSCIERGKVTVAFTLARKPLQDNLFYLCWILTDSQVFLKKMKYENPKKYDVSNFKGNKEYMVDLFSQVKKIIESKGDSFMDMGQFIFDPSMLYDVIYNKKASNSLTSVFDKSIHLVTNNSNYPTDNQNLNFVFATDKIWNEFWDLYYDKIIYIILFLVEISLSIFEKIYDIDTNISEFNRYIRNTKALLALSNQEDTKKEVESIFDILFDDDFTEFTCDHCDEQLEFSPEFVRELKKNYLFTCSNCGYVDRLGQYFTEHEFFTKQDRRIIIDNSDDVHWKIIQE